MNEMELEFDFSVVDDEPPATEVGQLEQFAERAIHAGRPVVLDIETGPLTWDEIGQYWTAPPKPGEFDPATVKYGNIKDEAKRAEKLAKAQNDHKLLLEGYQAVWDVSRQEFHARAALSAITGRVLAIGWYEPGLHAQPAILGSNVVCDCTEKAILADFWALCRQWLEEKRTIVGHNVLFFDLPFLIRRSWKHGLDVPREIRQGRFWSPLIRDTMVEWQLGPGMVKLDSLARFFNVGQKTEGVTGGDFARLWEENYSLACEYLRNDVLLTSKVATAIGLI